MSPKKTLKLAAKMLAAVPKGTSAIDGLIACGLLASMIIKVRCPSDLQREVTEKFVSDFYDFMLLEDETA
jgi:hypothetical protein